MCFAILLMLVQIAALLGIITSSRPLKERVLWAVVVIFALPLALLLVPLLKLVVFSFVQPMGPDH